MDETVWSAIQGGDDADLAVVVPGGVWLTYGALRACVESAVEFLVGVGIRQSDAVGLVFPNSAEAVVLFLAAALAGTAAPLNPSYTEHEFAFYLGDVGAQALVVPPGGVQAARAAAPGGAILVEAAFDDRGKLALDVIAPASRPSMSSEGPGPDDVALVLHTSGTTGRPKRVPLRHRNLMASIGNIASTYQLTSSDVSLCVMPLFHVHGLVASTLSTLDRGGTVIVPSPFNPLGFWRVATEFAPTWYSAVPTIHKMVASLARSEDPSPIPSLRFVRSCSSSLSPALMGRLEELYGVPVLEAYGMTEGSHQIASNPLPPGLRVPGSVGRGTGVEIRLRTGRGELLTEGEGEVLIRGPNVVDGYAANPQANAESFIDGWFRTGDVGTIDASGYLTLRGRIKELINRGGEKISPREIDEVLLQHPAVSEAVAFGVPHPSLGEQVAAAVTLRGPATKEEILAFCRTRLAAFKVPKTLYVVEAIPKTATGKIQRRQVADALGSDA